MRLVFIEFRLCLGLTFIVLTKMKACAYRGESCLKIYTDYFKYWHGDM